MGSLYFQNVFTVTIVAVEIVVAGVVFMMFGFGGDHGCAC